MITDLQARLRDKAEQAAAIGGCLREDMLYWQAATELARLTDTVERLEKANKALRDLWEKNKILRTKDGCTCRFEENGDLLESCRFHGDNRTKADALAKAAQTVVAIHEHFSGRRATASLKQAMAMLRVRLTDYQGDGK